MPRLLLNFGTPQEREFRLKPGPNSMGRGAGNDFTIDHHSVSSSHCQIILENGSVTIRDLGSTNGTYIDQVPVLGASLQSGQTLRLGEINLLFDADTPTELTATQAIESAPIVPTSPPAPAPPAPSGPPKCRDHQRYLAKYQCTQCNGFFCDLCVSTQRVSGIQRKQCRGCGAECLPINPLLLMERHEDDDKTFFSLMPKAFKYPFQGDGWILMVTGTLFYLFVSFIAHAKMFTPAGIAGLFVVSVFAFGYLFAYMTRIILTTADGGREMPDWPDFLAWGDVMGPVFQLIVTLLVCFIPIPLLALASLQANWTLFLILPALLLGCLYLPMAILAVAMFDTVTALNPLLIVPSIIQVYREYLVACAVLFAILVLQGIVNFAMNKLNILFIPDIICGFWGWYFLTVEMRILGLLYRTKKQELGWFKF
jgi:FHA domain